MKKIFFALSHLLLPMLKMLKQWLRKPWTQ